jgi:pimeloyl-ACP methyl ester carboxylesterase
MPFEKLNNRQVFYETHGRGEETIILMHHGFGCMRILKDVYPRFVAEGFRVVMFDRRGFGRSEPGEDFQTFYENEDRYRRESVAELRELKNALAIEECHLVGQCEGGVVGVDYAVKYPEDVRTLTVASTQCYSEVPMIELNSKKFIGKFSLLEPKLQLKMTEWHGRNAQTRYDQFAKYGGAYGMSYFDLRPMLPRVACPTLILYPDRSAIFDVEQAIALYRHLPKGEVAVFPRCGHNTYEQRPADYARTVLGFINRNLPGAALREPPAVTCLA